MSAPPAGRRLGRGGADSWREACRLVQENLLAERRPEGYWEGELSPSALATATAACALSLADAARFAEPLQRGRRWLVNSQNPDGGWGDTPESPSNVAATLLATAALTLGGETSATLNRAQSWLECAGGTSALARRYGEDRTFAVPILTACALAGLCRWEGIPPLPFELSVLPRALFRFLRLEVVSYALPALIGIGVALHRRCPSRPGLRRLLRRLAEGPSLKKLAAIQPASGGFLEAIPLTSFVAMNLAGAGLGDHPVAGSALQFLAGSQRADGSWPVEANLSVWLTGMSLEALGADVLQGETLADSRRWLRQRQQAEVHPYTQAAPGGWAWTHLPGGVPDSDDTAGALRALRLGPIDEPTRSAAAAGVKWLLSLQNPDGGWPTFCRGWNRLPFDRSAPDLTAHVLRALHVWREELAGELQSRIDCAARQGAAYLAKTQRPDGSWPSLWFGNQYANEEANPVFGTSRVLEAYAERGLTRTPQAQLAVKFLLDSQNSDGGWGGERGLESTIEETAVAAGSLLNISQEAAVWKGVEWLAQAVLAGRWRNPAPIGLYFARLWYHEKLYPLVFAARTLGRACRRREG